MRLQLSLLAFAVLATGQATTYNFGVDLHSFTRRQADGNGNGSPIVVTGVPVPDNATSIPRRLEVREMRQDPYKWELFVLALSMFQSVSQDDPLSWYQIAGIHGVPFQTWNDVGPAPGGEMSGYCPHGNVLFPTWHRPYLALYEQEINRLATLIATMYTNQTERQRFQEAAAELRVPYWDWAVSAPPGETHFPDFFWDPVVLQSGPRGTQDIRNPFYSYVFHPVQEAALIWSPLREWSETKRAPDTTKNLTSPQSQNYQINTALLSKLPEIQERLYNLVLGYENFNLFGSKGWDATQNTSYYDSIEAVHDIIHIYGGLGGHMTYVPLSAFDPLFWMHHATTDRLVTMWQVLNPDSWMTPMAATETSYNAPRGTVMTSTSPLTPFMRFADGTFWTSDDVRTTETFGYTYADTDPGLTARSNFHSDLVRKITDWYGASGFSTGSKRLQEKDLVRPRRSNRAPLPKSFKPDLKADVAGSPIRNPVKGEEHVQWVANVLVNVEALDGRFGIHFFIGQVPKDPKSWSTAANRVGTVDIVAMNRNTGSREKIKGSVPLTRAMSKLVAVDSLSSLDADSAEPFLRRWLSFHILGSDGREIDPTDVAGLWVGVASTMVTEGGGKYGTPLWGKTVPRYDMWGDKGR